MLLIGPVVVLGILLLFSSITMSFTVSRRVFGSLARCYGSGLKLSPLVSSSRLFSSSEDTVISRCTKKLTDLLKPQKVVVLSTNDDPNGSHIQVTCISTEFEGKSIVQRQRLVYKALWEELEGPVHAVDYIVAKTPKEAGM